MEKAAVTERYSESKELITLAGLKPDSFVSIATPHIGATLPALYAAATGFASIFVTVPTLKQLRMTDDANGMLFCCDHLKASACLRPG